MVAVAMRALKHYECTTNVYTLVHFGDRPGSILCLSWFVSCCFDLEGQERFGNDPAACGFLLSEHETISRHMPMDPFACH